MAALHPATDPIFDGYLCLRLTSNSDPTAGSVRHPELIEIAAVLVDAHSATPIGEFHTCVKPVLFADGVPGLPAAVTDTTGITAAALRAAPAAPAALRALDAWLQSYGFGDAPPARSCCVVSAGGPDIKRLLTQQQRVLDEHRQLDERKQFDDSDGVAPLFDVPVFLRRWASIYALYTRIVHKKVKHIADMRPQLLAEVISTQRVPVTAAQIVQQAPPFERPDDAVTEGAREARAAASALRLMLLAGARPDFTTAPDGAYRHWSVGRASVVGGAVPFTTLTPFDVSAAPSEAALDAEDGETAAPHHREDAPDAERGRGGSDSAFPARPLLPPLAMLPGPRRDPALDILSVDSVRSTMQPAEFDALIRKLAVLLRVDALKVGLDMTVDGFVSLDAVLRHPRLKQAKRAAVAVICVENVKSRFSMVYGRDGLVYIRANHSHTIEDIDVNLTPIAIGDDIKFAVHGTNIKHWPSIRRDGINRKARRFVILSRHNKSLHEADGTSTASPVSTTLALDPVELDKSAGHGLRTRATCYVCVDVQALLNDGIPVYVNANRAIVTPGVDGAVPPKYFVAAIDANGTNLLDN